MKPFWFLLDTRVRLPEKVYRAFYDYEEDLANNLQR